MPRPRPRTRLHVLAEAISSLDKADACLHEIDLRSTTGEVRNEIKEAREHAARAMETARQTYLETATNGARL